MLLPLSLLLVAACAGVEAPTQLSGSTETPASRSTSTATAAPTRSPDVETPSADPADDLDLLLSTLDAAHPDPWYGIPRDEFVAELDDLRSRIGRLSADEQMVEAMRLVALVGRGGRNAHMLALPTASPAADRLLLEFHVFDDGVYVVAADETNSDLVGARLVAVEEMAVETVFTSLDPLVSRDNENTPRWVAPLLLQHPHVLAGAGLVSDPTAVTMSFELEDGTNLERVMSPEQVEPYDSQFAAFTSLRLPPRDGLLWLSRQHEEFWIESLGEVVYAQYNSIMQPSDSYVAQVEQELDDTQAPRVVLDLRLNPGGEYPRSAAMAEAVGRWADDGVDVRVLVGPGTFSAATMLAAALGDQDASLSIGEATAGSPTTYSGPDQLTLGDLGSPLRIFMPSQMSSAGSADLTTVVPDTLVALDSAAYFAGLDPVLDAALAE